jgi:hypothetical protein
MYCLQPHIKVKWDTPSSLYQKKKEHYNNKAPQHDGVDSKVGRELATNC